MSRRRIGFWYRLAAVLCKPPLKVLIKRDWRGMENIPADGGFITVVNHNSHVDPFAYAHFQYNTGRVPRFLAKNGLFTKGFVGAVMRGTGQIPVYRESTDALSAYRAAIDAVQRGECVAFYPEGTITRDPDQWPMTGKTGAARVALETRCPVIPVAQWGANLLLPPYAKKPNLWPRKTHQVLVGPPVDLSRFFDEEISPELLKEATAIIMAAITAQLEVLRGAQAPATPYDPRQARIEQRRRSAVTREGGSHAVRNPSRGRDTAPDTDDGASGSTEHGRGAQAAADSAAGAVGEATVDSAAGAVADSTADAASEPVAEATVESRAGSATDDSGGAGDRETGVGT